MNLPELAKLILIINQQPLNRIRFAKTIYFVHKELIRKGIMQPSDISYIRSPLGPVPEGLLGLALLPYFFIQKNEAALFFEAEEYALNSKHAELSPALASHDRIKPLIQKTLDLLKPYLTASLVEASRDPSWLAHTNGTRYQITPADLKNTFPYPRVRIKIRIKHKKPISPTGALQANLLRGMLDDIVKESTDLEYPDQEDSEDQKDSKNHEEPSSQEDQQESELNT